MSKLMFKLAQKFEKKYAQNQITQEQDFAKFAPVSLQWNEDQILELQKLLNLELSAWAPNFEKLKEDGIYGPKTRIVLGSIMRAFGVTDPAKLVELCREKYGLQQYIDPRKYLINAVGVVVPNGPEVKKVQESLKQKKINLSVDSAWGPESYGALFNFQKQNNLPADGKLNKETVLILGL